MSATDFAAKFERVTGHTPLRWQARLYEQFLEGDIPCACDLPTGTGKTSVIALWYLAHRAGAPLPRRLVYVVDRRVVVDQASAEADRVRVRAADPDLRISTLRGQQQDNRRWLEDPSARAIIVGTVDMIGSRLLFSGYGVSRKMAPFHAGLLGADSLVVLDEAHLIAPFVHLIEAVSGRRAEFGPAAASDRELIPGVRILLLSATGRRQAPEPFHLIADDLEEDFVRCVVNAEKAVEVKMLEQGVDLAGALKKQAMDLAQRHPDSRIAVFCDKRRDAEAILKSFVTAKLPAAILVGERRVREREQAVGQIVDLGFLPGSDGPRVNPVGSGYLVATAAGEVGIDVDADHMVCDVVAWERMVQRLGRVNRRGGDDRNAEIIIVDQGPPKAGKTATAADARAAERHQAVLALFRACPDASPWKLRLLAKHRPEEVRKASSDEPLRPPLTRALTDAWSLTALEEHPGRPKVGPWLRGWVDEERRTTVIWRRHLPVADGDGKNRVELNRFFEAARPHVSEGLEAETWHVVEWAIARVARIHATGAVGLALRSGTITPIPAQKFRDPRGKEKEALQDMLAGARLVVPASWGGLSTAGSLDEREDSVVVAADGAAPEEWLGFSAEAAPRVPFRVQELRAEPDLDQGWYETFRLPTETSAEGEPQVWLSVDRWRAESDGDDDAAEGRDQLLADHVAAVEAHADRLLRRLAVHEEIAAAVRLAAHLHDEGKHAPRWQRAFRAPEDGRVWGKTRGPIDFKLLDRYRHEFGSVLHAWSAPSLLGLPEPQRDLVLHLIAAHHGWARPLIGISACDALPPSALAEQAREVALRFARLQHRWGPWGLAWIEALLRGADQAASRVNDTQVQLAAPATGVA